MNNIIRWCNQYRYNCLLGLFFLLTLSIPLLGKADCLSERCDNIIHSVERTPVTVSITGNTLTTTYNGSEQVAMGYTVSIPAGVTLTANEIFCADAAKAKGTDVGSYSMGLTAEAFGTSNENYDVTFVVSDGSLVITPAPVMVVADAKTKVYGTDDAELTATVIGLFNNDAISYSLSRETGENVGSYTITPVGDAIQGNYQVTYMPGYYTVIEAPLTISVFDSKVYDGNELVTNFAAPAVSVVGLVSGDYLTAGALVSNSPAVGTYVYPSGITITEAFATHNGISNYEVSYEFTQQITPSSELSVVNCAELTQTRNYNGSELSVQPLVNVAEGTSLEYSVNGAEWSATSVPGITNVGTVSVSVRAVNPNYDTTYCQYSLTVEPAVLTVTADAKTKVYGTADPELTATLTGLQNGEPTSVITYLLSRTAGEDVGEYNINPIGEVLQGNYTVQFVSASLTITPAIATVTAEAKTKVYGEDDPEWTATVTGLQNGDFASVITYTLSRTIGEDVGEYSITPSGVTNQGNYTVEYVSSTFVITPATAVVHAENKTKVYGEADPVLTAFVTGLLNGDGESVINYTLSRVAGEDVGEYVIIPSGDTIQGNYSLLFDPASLLITQATATVTADAKTKVYGEADPELTAIVTGLQNGDSDTLITYTLIRIIGETVGTYSIIAAGESSQGNYSVVYVPSNLSITQASAIVTADSKTKVYGETDPVLTATVTGLRNGDGESVITYMLSRTAGENVGEYTIIPTGDTNQGNYVVAFVPSSLSITPANATVTADNKTKIYGEADPELTATVTGMRNNDTSTVIVYTVNRTTGENVGEHIITPAGDATQGNYTVQFVSATLTITPATAIVTAENKTKVYGENDPELTAVVTGLQHGDDASVITYSLTRTAGENVGEYTIVPTGEAEQGNYNVLYLPSSFVITKATATVTAESKTKVYGEADPEWTAVVTGLQNGDVAGVVNYTLSRGTGENVGEYTITPIGDVDQGNYIVMYVPSTLVITPATVTVTAESKTKVYGEADPELTAVVTGLRYDDAASVITYMLNRTAGQDVGEYTITPSGDTVQGNYTVLFETATFVVTPATATVTADAKTKVYGEADPELTATVTGLQYNDAASVITYMLSRSSGENVGDYVIIPTGDALQGNYNVNYVVDTMTITKAMLTITVFDTKMYDGTVLVTTYNTVGAIVATGLANNDYLTAGEVRSTGTDVDTYTYPSGVVISEAFATYNGIGNYEVSYELTQRITRNEMVFVNCEELTQTRVYNGTPLSTQATVNVTNGTTLEYSVNGVDWSSVSIPEITSVGTVNVRVRATNANYDTIYCQYSLTIEPAELIVTAEAKTKVYGEADPELTATVTGLQNGEGENIISYSLSRNEGENVGEYAITPAGETVQGNYTVVYVPAALTITKATAVVTAEPKTKVYGENDPALTATVTGLRNGDASTVINYTLSREAGENVGEYAINPIGDTIQGNYAVQYVSSNMIITQATVTVTAENKTKVYGETDPALTATVTGLRNGDVSTVINYTLSRVAGENVGEYSITPSGNASQGNYNVQYVSSVMTITPAEATVIAATKTKIYGEVDPVLTATVEGLQHGDAATVISYTLSRTDGENVGEYTITPTGEAVQGNYNVQYISSNFVITPATVTVTADAKTKVYGETDPVLTATVTGLQHGDAATVISYSLSRATGEHVGEYAITPSGTAVQGNYNVLYVSSTLTVTPATVTVTAESKTKVYGEADPVLTAMVTGLQYNDEESVITYTLSRTAGENVGDYSITPSGNANQGDYTLVFVSSNLNITPATVTVTAESKAKVYGEADPVLTAVVTGLQNGDAVSVISYTLNRVAGENVGEYAITPTGSSMQGNYNVLYESSSLAISRATAIVSAESKTKIYGAADPELTATVTGLQNGDVASVISYTLSRTEGEHIGEYVITPTGAAEQGNYNVVYIPDTMVITKAELTIRVFDTKVYDGTVLVTSYNAVGAVVATGLAEGDYLTAGEVRSNSAEVSTYEYPSGVVITEAFATHQGIENYQLVYVITQRISRDDALEIANCASLTQSRAYNGIALSSIPQANIVENTIVEYRIEDGEWTTGSVPSITNVGSVNVIVRASNPNYDTVYCQYSLTVQPAVLTVTADAKTKVYGDADPELTAVVSGLQNGEPVSMISYTLSRTAGENVGEYTITPSGSTVQGNYSVEFVQSSLVITQATVIVTAEDKTKVYGEADPELTATVTGMRNGEAVTLISYTLSRVTGENVGTHAITPAGASSQGNYNVQYVPASLTITPAIATVTAENKTKVYGEADPVFTATVTGMRNGDATSVIYYTLIRTAGENVGEYTINPTGSAVQGNYTVEYVPASLVITQAIATVTADTKTKVYGEADPELTATVTGLQNGDSENVISYSLSRNEGENVGEYAITPAGETVQGNYTVVYAPAALTITKATAVVTADPKTKVYGESDSALTATVTGLRNGDASTVINYTLTRVEGENVGEYAITPIGDTIQGNYAIQYVSSNMTITQATATVTAENKTKVYGETDPELTATVTGLRNGDVSTVVNYTLSRVAGENVGEYSITPSGNASQGNYNVQYVSSVMTITPAEATVIAATKTKIYGEVDPVLTATVEGLQHGDAATVISYTLSRTAGEDVGEYTITPTGEAVQGNYNLQYVSSNLVITPATATVTADAKTKVYGETDPELTVTVTGLQHGDAASVISYTISRVAGEDVGEYAITPSGDTLQGNYNILYVPSTLTVAPATVIVTAESKTKVYGEADPVLTAMVTGLRNGDAIDVISYTLSREEGEHVGTYVITPTGTATQGNYTVQYITSNFIITQATATVTAENKTKVYGETDPELTATVTGLQLGDAANVLAYTLSRAAGENVGEYSITPSGDVSQGNYTIVYVPASLTITQASATVIAEAKTKVYGESDPMLTATVTGLQRGDAASVITYVLSRTAGENIGEYTITPSGNASQGNYMVAYVPSSLTITQATATVSADAKTKVYGEADPELTATVSGLQNGDAASVIAYTLSRMEGENAGEYTITPTGEASQGNYAVVYVPASLTIAQAIATVTAEAKTKIYGESDPVLTATVTGIQQGDLASIITYTLSREEGENVGIYAITPSGEASQGNYAVVYVPANLTITQATATVTAEAKTKVYGESDPVLTATVTGLQHGDAASAISYSLSRNAGENVGEYTITPSGNVSQGNYTVSFVPASLTITQAVVTVTAEDKTKVYGETDPVLTATVTGLQNGDLSAVITYTLSRAEGEHVGEYTIIPSGDTSQGNYMVQYVSSKLVITQATATVTAENKTKVYGSVDPDLTAIVTGLQHGDNESVITYTLSRTEGEQVGEYAIIPSGNASQGDYIVVYVPASLTITQAIATVTAESKTKVYGESDPVFTATVDGLQNGDLTSVITYALSRNAGENVGDYLIIPSGSNSQGNYRVVYVPDTLSITPATATVSAVPQTKVYGADDPELTVTVTGLQHGDAITVISYTVSRTAGENIGVYTITPSGSPNQGNYNVFYVPSNLTIVPAIATVTATAKTKVYGTADPVLTATVTGLRNGDNASVISYMLSRAEGENVGEYAITPSGVVTQGNYTVVFVPANLAITHATATVKAVAKTKAYGDADPELTATVTGMRNGESASLISYALTRVAGENVGNYAITPSGSAIQGNYAVEYVASTLTITRVQVTVAAVPKIKAYGDADPALTATVTGLRNGDNAGVISYSLQRTTGESIGSYQIIPSGNNTQGNYTVQYVSAVFTITRATATVTADNKTKAYGSNSPNPTLTATVRGMKNGESASLITYSLSCDFGTNAGSYPIIPSGNAVQGNYNVVFENGQFIVTRAIATVTAHSKSKVYGDPDPVYTATVSGMVNGESDTLITYTFTRDSNENVGNHPIMPTGDVDQGNYHVNFVSANLSISRASVTATLNSISKFYGDPDPEFTISVTGLKNGDDASVINFTVDRAPGENQGIYPLFIDGPDFQGNYIVTFNSSSTPFLTIQRAPVTIMADDKTKEYGEADPVLTVTVTGMKNGESPSLISYNLSRVSGENAGSYAIVVSGTQLQGNYNVTFVHGRFTITPIPVVVSVTGNTLTRTYNGAEQSVSGYTLVIPEGTPLTPGNFICSNVAVARGTNAGTYYMGLTADDFTNTNGNYGVTYDIVDGKLTIGRADVRVKANNFLKVLGDADPVFTATVLGLRGSDEASVLTYTFTRDPGDTVGIYVIRPQGAVEQGNYNVTYNNGTLRILEAWPSCPTIGTTTYSPDSITDRTEILTLSTPLTDVASVVQVVDAYYTVTDGENDYVVPAAYSNGAVSGDIALQSSWRGEAITATLTILFSGCETTTPISGEPLKICVPFANAPYISHTYNTEGLGKTALFTNGGMVTLKAAVNNRDDERIVEYGFLVSTNPADIATYNPVFAKSATYATIDTIVYNIGLDSCMKHLYYKPYLILNDCDSSKVYGQLNDFTMWHPDLQALTVSPSTTVTSGTEITLTAVATMQVISWPEYFGYWGATVNAPISEGGCGMHTDGSDTKTMEEWMEVLLNCPRAAQAVLDVMRLNVHDASFRYTWTPVGYSSPLPWSPGTTTTTPTQTTTYEGSAIFTYRGMVCKVSDTITVTVQ